MIKRLISPPSEPPGEIMSFGVSPVYYLDSDSDTFGMLLWGLPKYSKVAQSGVKRHKVAQRGVKLAQSNVE